MTLSLTLPGDLHADMLGHLRDGDSEQVCFMFTSATTGDDSLQVAELYAVPPDEFAIQSAFHVSLADEVRGRVIRRATELGGSLAEAHSHTGGDPASFSPTDLAGLEEWVPHVRWRLGGRPYIAFVFAEDSYDALVWEGESSKPGPLSEMRVGEQGRLRPTGVTYSFLSEEPA